MRSTICLLALLLMTGCAPSQPRRNLDILESPSSSYSDRLHAIEYFQKKGGPQYVEDLIRVMKNQLELHGEVAIALGRQGGPLALEYLEQQWEILETQSESGDKDEREEALNRMPAVAAGLSLLGNDQHVDVIFTLLESENEGIGSFAAYAGQFIRTPQMRLALYKTLLSDKFNFAVARCSAAYSLYAMRDPELKAVLEILLAGQEETHECFDDLQEELRNPKGR
ncbi:MAG: HEAT repeat domain-containing protein [Desulfovibrio sp.]